MIDDDEVVVMMGLGVGGGGFISGVDWFVNWVNCLFVLFVILKWEFCVDNSVLKLYCICWSLCGLVIVLCVFCFVCCDVNN